MKIYNKLIRDKIPQIINANGKKANVRVLGEIEYKKMLDTKLHEELNEYQQVNEKDQVEELADLVELVYAILENKGVSIKEFEMVRLNKKEERGGFKEKLFLVSVEEIEKEKILKQYIIKEEQIAREIDHFIELTFEGIRIKSPITDCIGYKIEGSKKFASLTIQDKHSLILHIGKKSEKVGIKLQEEIDKLLGKSFPRSEADNQKYPHQAYIKLEWVDDVELIKPFIIKAYESRIRSLN
jgi:predicted house-cleaning noncanonical NTP pyrophosphatase (MazG superfamily)